MACGSCERFEYTVDGSGMTSEARISGSLPVNASIRASPRSSGCWTRGSVGWSDPGDSLALGLLEELDRRGLPMLDFCRAEARARIASFSVPSRGALDVTVHVVAGEIDARGSAYTPYAAKEGAIAAAS